MDINTFALASSASVWAFLLTIGTIVVHVAFSAAVFIDARNLAKSRVNLVFVGPVMWSIAVLLGGVFIGLAYWIIHHSALSK